MGHPLRDGGSGENVSLSVAQIQSSLHTEQIITDDSRNWRGELEFRSGKTWQTARLRHKERAKRSTTPAHQRGSSTAVNDYAPYIDSHRRSTTFYASHQLHK